MSDTKENALGSNLATFIDGDSANVNISGSHIHLYAGGSKVVKYGEDRPTESDADHAKQPNKVPEPKIGDADLTWLVKGKIALYKKRPLDETTKSVFYGRQQILPGHWREVAIKIIPYEKKNFDELKLLLKLRHSNIIQIFDAGELPGNVIDYIYVVMELCSQNLRHYVEKSSFDFQTSFSLVQQMVEGLVYLHKNNITHRNLKPDNVLISPCKKVIKLTDFGLSVEIPEGQSAATVTSIGVGTEGYRAPETYQNIQQVTPSVDIFSFGLIIHFTFANGKHPFGTNPYEMVVNIMKNQNCDLSQILHFDEPNFHKRAQLVDLLRRTLQHNPSDRPTVKEILQSAFISGESLNATIIAIASSDQSAFSTVLSSDDQSGGLQKTSENGKKDDDDESLTLEAIQLTGATENSDKTEGDADVKLSNEAMEKNAESPMKGAQGDSTPKKSKGIFGSFKNLFNIGSKRYQTKSPHKSESKNLTRIRKIQDELQEKPLEEIGLRRSATLLNQLQKLRGYDDLDSLLQNAEYELLIDGEEQDESIQRVRDFISNSEAYSFHYLEEMADNLRENKCFVRALILYLMSNELHESQNVTPDDAVRWIMKHSVAVSYAADPLIQDDGRLCDIGMKYGLECMEKFLNDLRAIKDASPDVKALNEAGVLTVLTTSCNSAYEYEKSFRFGKAGVSVLEDQFGPDAAEHKLYSWLLYNLGNAHFQSGQYSDAKRYYVRAINADEKALDYESESQKIESIEASKRALANIQ